MCSRLFRKKSMQYLCRLPLALVILHFMCIWFTATKKCSVALVPLIETALFRFGELAADGHILCRVVSSSSHPHSFGVVSDSLRLLAVSSGDDLKRPYGIASWCGAAIGALGGNRRRDLTFLRRQKFSTWFSFAGPAFSNLLPLRAYESTQCVSVHTGTAEFDSFFSLSQHWCRQEQKLIFISLPLPLCSREVVWRRTRVMSFSPWREGFLADSYARIWPGHGATRRFGTTFMIFVIIAAKHPFCGPLHVPPEHARCAASCVI